jgi:hypothetical protein
LTTTSSRAPLTGLAVNRMPDTSAGMSR